MLNCFHYKYISYNRSYHRTIFFNGFVWIYLVIVLVDRSYESSPGKYEFLGIGLRKTEFIPLFEDFFYIPTIKKSGG